MNIGDANDEKLIMKVTIVMDVTTMIWLVNRCHDKQGIDNDDKDLNVMMMMIMAMMTKTNIWWIQQRPDKSTGAMTDQGCKNSEEGEEHSGPGGDVAGEQVVDMDPSLELKVKVMEVKVGCSWWAGGTRGFLPGRESESDGSESGM